MKNRWATSRYEGGAGTIAPAARPAQCVVAMTVRVLVVDDQQPFRDVARVVVESTDGFEITGEADSGNAAVQLARSLKPDLILMDVNLPDMSGTIATRKIVDADPRVVVMLVSTYEESDYASQAAECGAAGYISKSVFSPTRLAGAWTAAGKNGQTG